MIGTKCKIPKVLLKFHLSLSLRVVIVVVPQKGSISHNTLYFHKSHVKTLLAPNSETIILTLNVGMSLCCSVSY